MTDQENEKAVEDTNEAIALGAHLAVITAMRKHSDCKNIQIGGCDCLVNLLFPGNTSVPWGTIKAGGVEVIASALTKYPRSEDVQCKGLWALQNLFEGLGAAKVEVQQAASLFVMQLHGLDLVVKAMASKSLPAVKSCNTMAVDYVKA